MKTTKPRITKAIVISAWSEFVAKHFDEIIASGILPADTLLPFYDAMKWDDPVVEVGRSVVLPRLQNTTTNITRWREDRLDLDYIADEGEAA